MVVYTPTQAPPNMQTFDELRKWTEEEFRRLARMWTELDVSLGELEEGAASATDGPRAFPSAWTQIGIRPLVVQHGAGPGRVTLSHTPHTYATYRDLRTALASSTVWVDEMNGSDANPGTSALPFKTLTYAGSTSTAQIIHVRAGRYAPPAIASTDAAYAAGRYTKQFFLDPGVVVAAVGPRLQDQTFTLDTGSVGVDAVYKTTLTLTGAQTVQRVARRELYNLVTNQPLTFTKYASAAALAASSAATSGWFITTTAGNKDLYVRLAGGLDVHANRTVLKAWYLDTNADATWKVTGVPVLVQAVTPWTVLLDGVGLMGTNTGSTLANVYADGIVSRYAPLMAFQTYGGINYFKNCVGHSSLGDCFNYNASTLSVASQNIELDCIGLDAGDVATFGTSTPVNRNGSSAHDYVDILRAGCYYEGNWGPQVADVVNAATGTSWNIGCICGPTAEPQSIGFYAADPGRTSYWDMCHAYGNITALTAAGGVNLANDCVLEGDVVGTLGTYDPATGV